MRKFLSNDLDKSATKKILYFIDPLAFSKTVFIKNTSLDRDLMNFSVNEDRQLCRNIELFNEDCLAKQLGANKTTFNDKKKQIELQRLEANPLLGLKRTQEKKLEQKIFERQEIVTRSE